MAKEFDFIVVGGGTAGNVAAGRLAENSKLSVPAIEAGRGDPEKIEEVMTPAQAFECRNVPNDWKYKPTFIDRPDYTRVEKPNTRGKVLDGSSGLKDFTWVRGSKGTFDNWEAFGGLGWNWEGNNEYFDKASFPLIFVGLLELVVFPRIEDRLNKIIEYVKVKEDKGGKDPSGAAGQPHFEVEFVPIFAEVFQWHFSVPKEGNWLTIVDLMRPVSKPGFVKLQSADPRMDPYININFLEDNPDVISLREGDRFIDDMLMTDYGFEDIVGEDYPSPMPRNLDEAMDKLILERPSGKCRLLKNIKEGVVDGQLKVHRFKNLPDSECCLHGWREGC
ncbi:GMC oxidoreductase [Stipitochalara longipes BDJ]|nr:GMC oxidoreductase [Stipitochalara longipes BDJ]